MPGQISIITIIYECLSEMFFFLADETRKKKLGTHI